ncbi:MAG: DUF2177 family protein [Rhodocyclaceae bacterium]|nr:DUF2177 family protein [Rhodocyclaceae bacterium]
MKPAPEPTASGALRRHLYAGALVAAVFLPLDAVWLGVMSPRLYQPALSHLLAEKVDAVAALAFYLLYIAGVVVFAVQPAAPADGWRAAALRAALFGLVCYGTYDLTNQATLRDWPWHVTLIDLCWGAGATAAATLAARRMLRRARA